MKVLVVDDAESNIMLMRHLIEKRLPDCSVASFTDPVKALDWSAFNDPDLAIVDYMMPELDGIEFARRFREGPDHAETPLLMVTASNDRKVRHAALESGIDDFLNKPIDTTEFVARARNMLKLRVSRKHLADRASWLAEEVAKATRDILDREQETLYCLGRAADYRDPETGAHLMRMAHYSRHVARYMGLPKEECDLLLRAAPMHDIGKVGIPDHILLKPERLSPEEFELMKQHPVIGYEILRYSSSSVLRCGAIIAHTHHEKFDGSGYPQGLRGEAIPLHGRIVAVADVFDALTSERPYKKAWTTEAAVGFMRQGAGSHFDLRCIDAFLQQWDEVLEIRERFRDEDT